MPLFPDGTAAIGFAFLDFWTDRNVTALYVTIASTAA